MKQSKIQCFRELLMSLSEHAEKNGYLLTKDQIMFRFAEAIGDHDKRQAEWFKANLELRGIKF